MARMYEVVSAESDFWMQLSLAEEDHARLSLAADLLQVTGGCPQFVISWPHMSRGPLPLSDNLEISYGNGHSV